MKTLIYLVMFGVLLFTIGCSPSAPPTAITDNPNPTQVSVAQTDPMESSDDDEEFEISGEEIYQTQCASCHGVYLEGEENWKANNADGSLKAPPHDATGHTWHHPDSYLINRIKNGTAGLDPGTQAKSNMPAYSSLLTDDEIVRVLDYIKDSWPDDIRASQERTNQ